MNAHPKLVFCKTLTGPPGWKTPGWPRVTWPRRSPWLKHEPGDLLRSAGSITLVKQMIALGLTERLQLVSCPRILGEAGREPMFGGYHDTRLELASSTAVESDLAAAGVPARVERPSNKDVAAVTAAAR